MGCGWYRAPYYPVEALIDRRSVDGLTDELVAEFEHGVGETGVRPGIVGEIGTDKPWVSALEERIHRAVARAAIRTGMAVSTHGVQSTVGQSQLDIFIAEGMDPGRVVIGHADSWPDLDHYLAILDRGATSQFDFLGHRFDPVDEAREPRVVELLVELLDRGYGSRGLLSRTCPMTCSRRSTADSAIRTSNSTSCLPCGQRPSVRASWSGSRSTTRVAS